MPNAMSPEEFSAASRRYAEELLRLQRPSPPNAANPAAPFVRRSDGRDMPRDWRDAPRGDRPMREENGAPFPRNDGRDMPRDWRNAPRDDRPMREENGAPFPHSDGRDMPRDWRNAPRDDRPMREQDGAPFPRSDGRDMPRDGRNAPRGERPMREQDGAPFSRNDGRDMPRDGRDAPRDDRPMREENGAPFPRNDGRDMPRDWRNAPRDDRPMREENGAPFPRNDGRDMPRDGRNAPRDDRPMREQDGAPFPRSDGRDMPRDGRNVPAPRALSQYGRAVSDTTNGMTYIAPPDTEPVFPAPLPEFPAENQTPEGWNGNDLPAGEVLREDEIFTGQDAEMPFSLPANPLIRGGADVPEPGRGTLSIAVNTAEGAFPVEGATVLITDDRQGDRRLMALLRTNESGLAGPVSLPAPLAPPDAKNVPFAAYTAEVSAKGYQRARSMDIPVFAGIDATQEFSLVPLPAVIAPPRDNQTYFNETPDY